MQPAPRDPLDELFARNRGFLIAGYLAVLTVFLVAVSGLGVDAIVEIPHALFSQARGDRDSWSLLLESGDPWVGVRGFRTVNGEAISDPYTRIAVIAAYVLLQGGLLWGFGKIYLDRRRKWRGRTLASIVSISAMAGLLTLGAVSLAVTPIQTSWGPSPGPEHEGTLLYSIASFVTNDWLTILFGGWAFWMIIALIYWWRRDPLPYLPRCIRILLAGSWIEFSLALPIDIASRNQTKDCPCAAGTWMTLLVAAPVMIWSVGPALYLLYRRERELSLAAPGRAAAILLRKSAVAAPRIRDEKVEQHVSTARTLSLALILLGCVGLQIGIFNNQRGRLFNEARGLVVAEWLKGQFKDDKTLQAKLAGRPLDDQSLHVAATPFGDIAIAKEAVIGPDKVRIFGFPVDLPGHPPFAATVKTGDETWKPRPFSLDDKRQSSDLDKILRDLEIDSSLAPDKSIVAIKEKLYSRRVRVPGVDFSEFSTESAAWLVALICPLLLVSLRNVVRNIFRGADYGIGEPWLVLDSETPAERVSGTLWLLATAASGWLATFGLVLTVMDVLQLATPSPSAAKVGLIFLVFLVLLLANSVPAVAAALDLLRLRELRHALRSERA